MIFEKPSTRTRISFDLAVKQLGGKSLILNPDEIHYGSGNESLHDTAKILSQYADIVMLRTNIHKKIEDFSKYLDIQLFKQSLQSMVDRIRALEPLGNSPVMAPGDPEKILTLERTKHGIPIDKFKYKEYLEISNLFSNCLIND